MTQTLAGDDDEIRALENRLRVAGWANKPAPSLLSSEHKKRRHLKTSAVEPDHGFGVLDARVRAAGEWLADHRDDAEWPIRQFVVTKFGLSYDDAVRAVAEAER